MNSACRGEWRRESGSPQKARGWVSSMIELIATAAGVASAFIFLMHAIDAYRA